MQNENPNKDFHWKGKLEQLENLPGETFNKEASWDKLHSRLKKKPVSRKVFWYWAAAACLLPALLTPWFLSNKKEPLIVKNIQEQQKIQFTAPVLLPTYKDSISVTSSLHVKRKLALGSIKSREIINTTVANKMLKIENAEIGKVSEKIARPEMLNPAANPADTESAISSPVAAKKKLRVVHINELGDPIEEIVATHKTENHSFQLKFANQEVYVNPAGDSRNGGVILLKTKNSPN
ncbi:MAG: hypothetical protein ABI691_12395 [Ginsengibacter sp.]